MHAAELIREIWQTHRKLLFLLAALLVSNLILYIALQQFFVPMVEDREHLFINRQAEARQLLKQAGGYADTPEQRLVLARQDIVEFLKIIPEHTEFTGLLNELMVLAYRADLNIDQISYSHKQSKNLDLLYYDLSFNVNGRYEQLKQFIHSLEQSPRIMAIQQIGLSSRDAEGSVEVSLRLKLETVFHAEAPQS